MAKKIKKSSKGKKSSYSSSKGKKSLSSKKKLKASKGKIELEVSPEAQRSIFAVLIFLIAGLSFLSVFEKAGVVGEFLFKYMILFFGAAYIIFPLALLLWGYFLLMGKKKKYSAANYIGIWLFVLSFNGFIHSFIPLEDSLAVVQDGVGGGYIGVILAFPLLKLTGVVATVVILVALLVISFLLMINKSFSQFISDIKQSGSLFGIIIQKLSITWYNIKIKLAGGRKEERYDEMDSGFEETEIKEEVEVDEVIADQEVPKEKSVKGPTFSNTSSDDTAPAQPKKKIKYKKVDIPMDLLDIASGKPTSGNIVISKLKIQKTLESFNIPVEMGPVAVGPTVTQYTLKPADGVKLSKITSLADDLALSLAAHPLRIEAPIPGKSLVGVEVPNQTVAMVRLRELLESKEFKSRDSQLTVPLGKDVAGNTSVADIAKMPHCLVAGSTGSGKSVCLNEIIIALLYQNSPETLRFIMVDPKRVELPSYNGIPHLLTPVITDVKKTINALKWAVAEMDRRYQFLEKFKKRNIIAYNEIAEEKIPYIVIIIDEMADLMINAANEVESLIVRIAQMARAVGIHLVLATQRPSVDVITGLIKANIPTRIAFSVASITDSRTILDTAGADKLIGRGDMLFMSQDITKPRRLQGAFVADEEVKRVVNFVKAHGGDPDYDESVVEKVGSENGAMDSYGGGDDDDGDELFGSAKQIVLDTRKASTSFLQRKLKVGYARAARLMDLLEDAGVVGAQNGAKPREILIGNETEVEPEFEGPEMEEETFPEAVEEDVAVEEQSQETLEEGIPLPEEPIEKDDGFDEEKEEGKNDWAL